MKQISQLKQYSASLQILANGKMHENFVNRGIMTCSMKEQVVCQFKFTKSAQKLTYIC